MSPDHIKITGARVNNLKNVSCDIPHEKLTVITGPSGSGKSSLAFDTLYAEGQRRYIESMSSYARQFLARIEKPDVDNIQHVLPAIALEQKNHVKNARSTVGTATEIYDYLRLMYANAGKTICDECGGEVTRSDPFQIQKALHTYEEGTKILLLAPVSLKEFHPEDLIKQGFYRIFKDGEMVELTTVKDELTAHDSVRIVVDRLIVKHAALGVRILESIRNALVLGHGKMDILRLDTNESKLYQNQFACVDCHKEFKEPTANFFSFNSPLGACPACEGYGRIIGLDMDKVLPNKNLSISQGLVHPFTKPSFEEDQDDLMAGAKRKKIPVDVPYKDLNKEQKAFVLAGAQKFFDWLDTKRYKMHVRIFIARYRGFYPCPECLGSRLHKEALNVYIDGKNILDVCNMPIHELVAFFEGIQLNETQRLLSERILRDLRDRLHYLDDIGLEYLTLNRQFRTLSNGEAQRINLSAALGSSLTDTLYVLDEPTVGLHARDTDRLIKILQRLRNHGNTIVVVEHDPEVILEADHVIDMGPSGGEEGGRIVYEGPPAELRKVGYSLTARYLNDPLLNVYQQDHSAAEKTNGKKAETQIEKNGKPKKKAASTEIVIAGACGNNLKNVTARFPKNTLCCVTGVSGSGKSTLIKQTLFAAYEHSQSRSIELEEAPHDEILGLESFADVLLVDQSPPGRSARSNPVTYVKAYDDIRKLYAETRKAQVLGISPGHFSFNTPGGRCETCEGLGTLTIDMQFMADVTVVCHDCQGRRFNLNVLSVEVDGKNISDILNLTIAEAIEFFSAYKKIVNKLRPLQEIGLGYLKLGQSTSTLSGGEAQRLKLASYLPSSEQVKESKDHYLFLFDEPTTGLHMADIALLVQAFRRLLQAGHSLIVIEHNIDFIAQCDYLMDLGPEGGDGGGEIIAEGSVDDLIANQKSHTGKFLAKRLQETQKKIPISGGGRK